MKKPNTWADLPDDCGMRGGVASAGAGRKSAGAVGPRRHPEPPPERPREGFVAQETARQGDVQHRIVAAQKPCRAAAQAEAQRELLGRFAGDGREHPVQVKWGQPSVSRKRGQRQVVVQMGGGERQRGLHAFEGRCVDGSLQGRSCHVLNGVKSSSSMRAGS